MSNVSEITNCYGCGVCTIACNRKLISIELDKDGFYTPRISDRERCTDCGLCTKVCAYQHDDVLMSHCEPQGFAAWSTDSGIRHRCSSGGVGYEIGRSLMRQGYQLCGVRYNAEANRAEHYIAATEEQWAASVGSKYIQSYTADALSKIDRKGRYLITGTPCQIDSLRRYLRTFHAEDHFVLLDFFCHGVPSKLIWDKYIRGVERHIGKATHVAWRDKTHGWHDSYAMTLHGDTRAKIHTSRISQGDNFLLLFLGNQCLGKACYHDCKYKHLSSAADIRIGDLWGTTYKDDEKGVSALIALTEKGKQVIAATETITLTPHAIEVITEGQMNHRLSYPTIMRPLQLLLAKTRVPITWQALVSRYVNKLKNKLHLP